MIRRNGLAGVPGAESLLPIPNGLPFRLNQIERILLAANRHKLEIVINPLPLSNRRIPLTGARKFQLAQRSEFRSKYAKIMENGQTGQKFQRIIV